MGEDEPALLARLLAEEQLANAHRVNIVRCYGISAFFGLFLVLGVALGMPEWRGNLSEFAVYWIAAWLLYGASRAVPRVHRLSGLSIALLDVPMVFILQWTQFPTAQNPGAIAGYNLGIYVFLVILSALSLSDRTVYATAATAAVFEGLLQYLAGISTGAIIATAIIMSLAGAACAYGSRRLVRMITALAADMAARRLVESQVERSLTEVAGLSRELEIASRIQVSILPRSVDVPAFEIAAWMEPASEVGGDYYDIRPTNDGCWIGIGDVTGHGLNAGLVMLMVQTAIASLVSSDDDCAPAPVLQQVNRVIHDNVRKRLATKDHVTCSLMRFFDDGRVLAAGQHEPMLIFRAATGICDEVDVPGTWLGVIRDIGEATTTTVLQLAQGDIVVLHTDGVVEAPNASGQRFGLERLKTSVTEHAAQSAHALLEYLRVDIAAWQGRRDDDLTLVVLRWRGSSGLSDS